MSVSFTKQVWHRNYFNIVIVIVYILCESVFKCVWMKGYKFVMMLIATKHKTELHKVKMF